MIYGFTAWSGRPLASRPTDTKISFHRLLDEISRQLGDARHPKSEEFALLVLALARLMPEHRGSAAKRLNIVLASVCDLMLACFSSFILGFQISISLRYRPFDLGAFDLRL